MRPLAILLVMVAGLWLASTRVDAQNASPQPAPCLITTRVDGIINTATASYLQRALESAQEQNCAGLLLELDTPGGLMEAMREIVRSFLGAPVPVIVHVTPSGARAGSAGMFITIAAHVAAMAPGSNIGAAHPVMVGGGPQPEDSEMARKIVSDAAALARAIANERDRNAIWAEQAVRESASLTAYEAMEQDVIDLVVASRTQLLEQVDGRSVVVAGTPTILRTTGARLVPHEMTIQQRVLNLLGNPNITYVLFMLGLLGLMIEFYNPGLFVPAGLGLLFLLLGAIGMNILPINLGGVVLLVIAVGLFIAELYTATSGLLTLAGLAALIAGAALLLDRESPDFFADANVRLSWGLVLPLAFLLTFTSGLLAWYVRTTSRRGPQTGREALVGAQGIACSPIGPKSGMVLVHGERWSAVSSSPIEQGQPVRIVGIDRLTLTVTPDAPSTADTPPSPTGP